MLGELTNALDQLDKAIETHANKLEPVLSPCSPEPDNPKTAAPDEVLCDVADRLRGASRRIHLLRANIEALTNRAEA